MIRWSSGIGAGDGTHIVSVLGIFDHEDQNLASSFATGSASQQDKPVGPPLSRRPPMGQYSSASMIVRTRVVLDGSDAVLQRQHHGAGKPAGHIVADDEAVLTTPEK
jgi:hypothetical protein